MYSPVLLTFTNMVLGGCIREVNLIFSLFFLFIILLIALFFDFSQPILISFFGERVLKILNFEYWISIDGLSIIFIFLSAILFFISICANFNLSYRLKEFFILLTLTYFFLLHVFSVMDFFFFYILFEAVLIPMFLIIGIWGSRERKVYAAYKFFLYTLFGSLFMLTCLVFFQLTKGSNDLSLPVLSSFSASSDLLLWLGLFLGLAVKIPIFPVHLWLPEAHVEAPTTGSMLLAGILLKLGGYGIIKFMLPLFFNTFDSVMPLILTVGLFGMIFASFVIFSQVDVKKIIAYSSIAHMNTVLVGIGVKNLQALFGSVLTMFSHGLVSASLFFMVGSLYERFKTRIILYYSGLMRVMPVFSSFFIFFNLSNLALPGTLSFLGEFFILLGSFNRNSFVGVVLSLSMIFSASYSLLLVNRVLSGNFSSFLFYFSDLSRIEFFILSILSTMVIILGLW